ncbi:MAG: polyprenol monophosphomannose synthase [Promethearchaeota archaeon]
MQASVVLPTFNESQNIGKLIQILEEIFDTHNIDGEIVVVDDNSPDGTAIIARKLAEDYGNIKVIRRPQPMGVGSAVKDGIKHTTKDTIILMDCDFSHPPALIPQLIKRTKYADIVIASRYAPNGGMIAPRIRVLASRIVNFFVKLVVNIPVNDATGGYHAIKRYVFDTVDFTTPDGDYDIELLGNAGKKGFQMIEYPYVYQFRESGASKTFSIRYVLRYFLTALKVRIDLL